MTHNITIEIDEEADDVLASKVDEINKAALTEDENATPITVADYLRQRVLRMIASDVTHAHETRAAWIAENSKVLPYETRKKHIEMLVSEIKQAMT